MSKLPAIQDLYGDIEMKQQHNDLSLLLNQPPSDKWVRQHPFIKNVKYIPIQRIEWLLTRIFIKWRVEIKSTVIIANSVVVTVRLHYLDVVSNEWDWQEGIGAAPIQTDKDAAATDFSRVKTDAVMKAAPAAESYAVKDAAEKIGKLFGKDLNRADQIGYNNLADTFKDYELITTDQFNMIESLLSSSTYDEDQKSVIEREMSGYTQDEARMCITALQANQLDRVKETGTYSKTDLVNHKIKDNE